MNWITAICVTNRHWMVRQAWEMFLAQTYPFKRLLFCVGGDHKTIKAAAGLLSQNATLVIGRFGGSLGVLRNTAINNATTPYVMQWDDDDIHGPRRMTCQMEFLQAQNADACTLSRIGIHDRLTGEHYLAPVRKEGWENTLLARRAVLIANPCPNIQRGEDTPPIAAMHQLGQLKTLDEPEHYTYIVHGRNVWDRAHFEGIFAKSTPCSCDHPNTLNWLKKGNWICNT